MSDKEHIARLEKLLKEAVKIVHCHARNTDKDWLTRARQTLRGVEKSIKSYQDDNSGLCKHCGRPPHFHDQKTAACSTDNPDCDK